jgi:hypothetical protein
MKVSIVLCFLCCGFFFASAQSVYELKYKFYNDKDTNTHSAFVVRYDDGTGFYRVRVYDDESKAYIVAEMEMNEGYAMENGAYDYSKLYFKGSSPHIIMGDKTYDYAPELFWFLKNPSTNLFEPLGVTSPDDDGKFTAKGNFVQAPNLIELPELTEELVAQYFNKEEEFYQNLFGPQATRGLTPEEQVMKMHIIAIANTEDDEIGISCQKDQSRNIKTFSYLAEYLGIKSEVIKIEGSAFGKATLENVLNSMRPSPQDIVIFCYSGHGFMIPAQNKKYPNIDLRSQPSQSYLDYYMNMEDIYATIVGKGARMNLVISDCCNNDPTSSNTIGADIAQTRSSGLGWSMDNCRKLFMDPKRKSILMTSADQGEKAACNTTFGGFFSYYFKVAMENQFSQFKANASWEDVLEDARKQTITKAEATYCGKPQIPANVCKQHPIFKVNGE